MKNAQTFIGSLGQWISVFLSVTGILLLVHWQGVNGTVFIAAGAVFFGVFTKIMTGFHVFVFELVF